jgi:ribosomal protection tetracycline resistance protein
VEGEIPAARVHELQQQLPALTRGEGVLESAFEHYQPAHGAIPSRPQSDHNPLNREEYLLRVVRRVWRRGRIPQKFAQISVTGLTIRHPARP